MKGEQAIRISVNYGCSRQNKSNLWVTPGICAGRMPRRQSYRLRSSWPFQNNFRLDYIL
ncbi:hypothetical protein [Paenibacillus thiaminolyticus]|uniref:hypothetical protein n=1 Tax=Paenibacillus thiaminolyticus TaxID=49283 RepID=UPI0016038568|nr:hypothetical protein [Paenibacillus thiaminolyticus]